MYAYPLHITDKLIDTIAKEQKVVKYLDMPIQHANNKILKSMNRKYTAEYMEDLISKLRQKVPSIAIRTSIIVGYPRETKKDFNDLCDFIKRVKFDRLGAFAYSREKGTAADKQKGHISEKEKSTRVAYIMALQEKISKEKNKSKIGKTLNILIEVENKKYHIGRSQYDAPDIDGNVYVNRKVGAGLVPALIVGKIIRSKIKSATAHDLFS